MVEAGVDVFRLNFSHGSHEQHTATLEMIRRIGADTGAQLAVLQDLCGPKIRLGEIPGGVVVCDQDAIFVLAVEPDSRGDGHHLTSTYRALADDLVEGQMAVPSWGKGERGHASSLTNVPLCAGATGHR